MTAPMKNRDTSLTAAEPVGKRLVTPLSSHQHRLGHGKFCKNSKKQLQVMKFGGSSVADAFCIERVTDIVRAAADESDVVVVVSAMSGVTNRLVEAAAQSEMGNHDLVATIFKELRQRHETAAIALISSIDARQRLLCKIQELVQEGQHHCQDVISRRELTLRMRDSIVGLGERLSAPLVAAALIERGLRSEAIEATELVVTNSCHGAAEPDMDLTRKRCEARLRPLLLQGIVTVVTGFIGATVEGVLTTLGRNSSDYSGTIMGAALEADEVTLWTDVDGILTADPRLVPEASSILEMSYREASELAELGAKVLHPKTLRPVTQFNIPLSIRNTFAPHRPGTKITAAGPCGGSKVKALAVTSSVAMITVRGSSDAEAESILSRTLATAESVRADVRLIGQSLCSPTDIWIVVTSPCAEATAGALRSEFVQELALKKVQHINLASSVAIIAVVGENALDMQGIAARVTTAMKTENLHVLASARGSSQSSISFVLAQQGLAKALIATHRVLNLSTSIEV